MFWRSMRRHEPAIVPVAELLAQVFVDLGHDVTVLTTAATQAEGLVEREGHAEVHYLGDTQPGLLTERYWRVSAAAFDRLHAARPFDLLVGRGAAEWGALSRSAAAGRLPLVAHAGTYPRWLFDLQVRAPRLAPVLAPPYALLRGLKKPAERRCLQRAARVVCNSPALARALERASWWRPPRTAFIPYGFDLTPFLAVPSPPPGPRRLVFVGRVTLKKGPLDLVDILARVARRDVVMEVIGPADARVTAAVTDRAQARGVGARFRLAGPAPNETLPGRLAGAVAFLFPSTHPEGLSKAVMEAMAAGLPVIAYDIPGMRVLVEDGVTGWVVPARDTAAAAACVDRLVADPALGAAMGAAARARLARDFGPATVAAQWDALLRDVVGDQGRVTR